MKDFFNKYKSIILPLILLLIFAVCTALTWGKWGHIIYDCFREAVVPQALLDGKVLYRDITNLYPPLAYQFNALFNLWKLLKYAVLGRNYKFASNTFDNLLYCKKIFNRFNGIYYSIFYYGNIYV